MSPRDNTVLDMQTLAAIAGSQPYRLLFATVSGAHLYGFPSRNSDVDLRGVHLLPLEEVVGLQTGPDTLTHTWTHAGTEVDLVTHDAAKFFRLLLRRNGYVLEQVLSPLTVITGDDHGALCDVARDCVTRNHAHHYQGFASTQWELYQKTRELKPLLYTFRVLFTGIWLMNTGEVQAHLPTLLHSLDGPRYVSELIELKLEDEHVAADRLLPTSEQLTADLERLRLQLVNASEESRLPDQPTAETAAALNDLLIRLRRSAAAE